MLSQFVVVYDACVLYPAPLRDFPVEVLKPFGVVAITPDDFVLDQIELSTELVIRAVRRQKDSLKNPVLTWNE